MKTYRLNQLPPEYGLMGVERTLIHRLLEAWFNVKVLYEAGEKFDRLYSKNPEACPLGAEPMKMCDEYCTPYYSLNDIVETYEVYQIIRTFNNLETVRRI